jgi:hypothetical protein
MTILSKDTHAVLKLQLGEQGESCVVDGWMDG